MLMEQYDLIVIGAGVVGCAIAESAPSSKRILVLERNAQPGQETSQHNSGVIHSGVHLDPTFLKSRLVAAGKKLVVEYCERHPEVAFRQVGMNIVVAPSDFIHLARELKNLIRMLKRARAVDVECRFVSRGAMRRREPEINCLFALNIPENCIIDAGGFVRSLETGARSNGACFRYDERCVAIEAGAQSVVVKTDQGYYTTQLVVNAAGLEASTVASLAGYRYGQVFYRGEYYEVSPESGIKVDSLVYPVHRPGKPGLGVHITPRVDGRLLLGPNAKKVGRNTDYGNDRTDPLEFYRDVKPFLPRLQPEHLRWAYAGIRPKLSTGKAENDFLVSFDSHPVPMVNLIGIESPGLTAALAIARYVWSQLDP